MKMLPWLLFLFTAFLPCTTLSQDALLYFSRQQVENQVLLSFTIKAGNTCNGIQIYRSTDSTNFAEIGDIQGICGSNDKNESYSFTDNSPAKNQTNYYRLQLGTLGYSHTINIFFIAFSSTGVLLYPNPVTEYSKIYYSNSPRGLMLLRVFSASGECVLATEDPGRNEFELDAANLQQGIYYFTITTAFDAERTTKHTGRFLVTD